ncbi:hypothetical protein WHR41_05261 [Cladosporium halotolerans]|uniref:Lytic polysaccharide monooxygenase n=1 Tax=Cladosporium halotolerans TaxID=1052096 RepID=A0AB34KT37_9PEZI
MVNSMTSVGRMAVAAASIFGMANAHMFIAEPKPLQGYSPKDPLDKSGSNFPCHGAPLPSSGGQKIAAGETFPLKLELGSGGNTAVHGGGSCQLAVTYETDSTKAADPSSWNVIYSIEGGCPANAAANLNTARPCTSDGEAECVHSWDVPMPKGIKSGNAILSWTWFNTIGNREMYQNCVNVDITGGTGDEMGSFPPLFVANIGDKSGGCETEESTDVLFPSPGQYVTTMSATAGKNWPKATPKACGGSGGSAPQPTSYGSASAASSTPAAQASSASASSAPAYTAPAVSSGVQSYMNQKGRETATTFATAVAAPSSEASAAAPAPTGYSSGSSSSGTSSNATSNGDCEPCSEDGALVCIGDSQFGICDHSCAVPRDLAAGTVCADGVIGAASKSRFARRHAHFNAHVRKH